MKIFAANIMLVIKLETMLCLACSTTRSDEVHSFLEQLRYCYGLKKGSAA
jgi:hypothetical protein